jgi:ribosomal protein S21
VNTWLFVQLICELLGIWLKNQIYLLCGQTVLLPARKLNGGPVLRKVVLREGESREKLLRRFRKAVTRSGVMGEVRKKRWFAPKSEQSRMAEKKAIRRQEDRESRRKSK